MIRNRYSNLLHFKQSHRNKDLKNNNSRGLITQNQYNYPQLWNQPDWYETYHNHRDDIKTISQNNDNILLLTSGFENSPTVYSLKQLQKLIETNVKLINQVESWVNVKPINHQSTRNDDNVLWAEIHKNIRLHFAMQLSRNIMTIFQSKSRISAVNEQLQKNNISMHSAYGNTSYHSNMNNSFNMNASRMNQSRLNGSRLNQSHLNASRINQSHNNISFNRNNQPPPANTRPQQQFDQISQQIQSLNTILGRMNTVVKSQGELVNRIDENINDTKGNVLHGRKQLQKRLQAESGEGEFSFYGRVNQAISTLYFVNLGLILIFIIKNVI